MRETLYLLIDLFSILVSLVLMVAAVITAVRCTQKKLAPTGAWLMTAGFAIGFMCDIGFAVSGHLLINAFGVTAYQATALLLSLVNLAGLIAIGAGIALIAVKPARPEAIHG